MAISENMQFTMGFTADVSQAVAELKILQNNLTDLSTGANMSMFEENLTSSMRKGMSAARDLKIALEAALNPKTGNLDLSKFSAELKKGQMDLNSIAANLSQLGPEGQVAFNQLVNSVQKAEMPLRKTNTALKQFGDQLGRTFTWTVSSGIINNTISAMRKAVDYAEDLNKSLNDIRIVSGKSADEMTKFAVQANKAAKGLSASTLDYTNASLIYAQQGLDDAAIEERAEITLKMAHAAGQSASTVSDQLTAVWNNFYDGSQSLEHFADAMVKLGADTASSSDEIAEGLEKFAAIGNTVGLSFDNAAAALTTLTAVTRQSADVGGTALILRA